jgi:hypothetical protein
MSSPASTIELGAGDLAPADVIAVAREEAVGGTVVAGEPDARLEAR